MNAPTNLGELREFLKTKGYKFLKDQTDYFHIEFDTGYILSVAWGGLNYCSGRMIHVGRAYGSDWYTKVAGEDAEIAIWTVEGTGFYRPEGWENDTKGWVQIPEILRIVSYLAGEPVDVSQNVHTL